MDTGYLLINTSKNLKYFLNKRLLSKNVTIQQWAVIQQVNLKRECTAAEIASNLNMDKTTISGILSRIELKGLLKKRNDPTDQRVKVISLSLLGKTIVRECESISKSVVNNYLSELTQSEKKNFKLSIKKKLKNEVITWIQYL
ncbi:MarR family winged helix-turn-helix transcriptional regulator [Pediococcus pentosaceus]|uniref:MarR family winged helix-turn-helix transcriptional regulator n=1 Tax=Pediococcus pentosaceus TaxID=1255 RepID=UPI00201761C2|nr:MarR family winged helix-turn-helix transcriptional regulator [Pediococcus pentosaceus]MCL3859324.1 MarR family winged helix-turn-helix transcriptional regulator [Pediococcus pentosaceus]